MKQIFITTEIKEQSEIWIGKEFFNDPHFLGHLESISKSFALITDDIVEQHFGKKLQEVLQKKGLKCALFSFPHSERSKTRKTKEKIEDQMQSEGFGKESAVIALGGGVVTDLAGFVASSFCRGLPLIFLPTTLLAMVDAAIGGKNGVNTSKGKNLIGTIYQPEFIAIDTDFLKTLPFKELLMGIAEVLKYGLIAKPSLFSDFQNISNWQDVKEDFLMRIIEESVLIKKSVVQEDPYEKKGYRRILNFGHTIGHAVEGVENYLLSHGEAVAIGLVVESYLSHLEGYLSKEDFEEILNFFERSPFALQLSSQVTKEKLKEKMAQDKKHSGSSVRFVLIEKIGAVLPFNGKYCSEVTAAHLEKALDWMLARMKEV